MRSLNWMVLVGSGLLASVGSGIGYSQNVEPEDRLYGSWDCELAADEEGVKMSMEYDITYARDGTATGSGTLWLKTGQFPEMVYSVTSRSEWEITAGHLVQTASEIDLVNTSHPRFDRLFNPKSLIPDNASESSEILVLDESRLRMRSESYGTIVNCARDS